MIRKKNNHKNVVRQANNARKGRVICHRRRQGVSWPSTTTASDAGRPADAIGTPTVATDHPGATVRGMPGGFGQGIEPVENGENCGGGGGHGAVVHTGTGVLPGLCLPDGPAGGQEQVGQRP